MSSNLAGASPPPIRTLVVARPDRLGDVVLSSSCFGAVRACLPGAALHWLVADRMQPLFHRHPALAGVLTPGPGALGARTLRLARAFWGLRPDAVALLQPDRAVEMAGLLARVPVRAGFARRRCRPQFLTHAAPYRKSEGAKHEALYNFDVLGLLGVRAPERLEPALSPDPAARARLGARGWPVTAELARCAALHLAAHGEKRRAPLAAFGALARWLRRERGLRLLLVGTETDPPVARVAELAGLAPSDFIDTRGATDTAELAWLLDGVALCAARDSGPAHVAAALGRPTLVFAVDARPIAGMLRWRPLGPRVEVLETPSEEPAPAAVLEAAARLLR